MWELFEIIGLTLAVACNLRTFSIARSTCIALYCAHALTVSAFHAKRTGADMYCTRFLDGWILTIYLAS